MVGLLALGRADLGLEDINEAAGDRVDDADKHAGGLVEQAEQLGAQDIHRRHVSERLDVLRGDQLLAEHGGLHLELLLVLEELLQDLRNGG